MHNYNYLSATIPFHMNVKKQINNREENPWIITSGHAYTMSAMRCPLHSSEWLYVIVRVKGGICDLRLWIGLKIHRWAMICRLLSHAYKFSWLRVHAASSSHTLTRTPPTTEHKSRVGAPEYNDDYDEPDQSIDQPFSVTVSIYWLSRCVRSAVECERIFPFQTVE